MRNDTMDVQLVQNRIRILQDLLSSVTPLTMQALRTNLAETRSEDNALVNLPHLLQEVVNARALDDIYVMPVVFNLDRHHVVRLLDRLHDI